MIKKQMLSLMLLLIGFYANNVLALESSVLKTAKMCIKDDIILAEKSSVLRAGKMYLNSDDDIVYHEYRSIKRRPFFPQPPSFIESPCEFDIEKYANQFKAIMTQSLADLKADGHSDEYLSNRERGYLSTLDYFKEQIEKKLQECRQRKDLEFNAKYQKNVRATWQQKQRERANAQK